MDFSSSYSPCILSLSLSFSPFSISVSLSLSLSLSPFSLESWKYQRARGDRIVCSEEEKEEKEGAKERVCVDLSETCGVDKMKETPVRKMCTYLYGAPFITK